MSDSLPALTTDSGVAATTDATEEKKPHKRKRSKRNETEAENDVRDPDLDMSTSPEAPNSSPNKKSKKVGAVASPTTARKASIKKSKARLPTSPNKSKKKAPLVEASLPSVPVRGKACICCGEKKIKCNEARPACNQCRRGLWTCQCEVLNSKKRSMSVRPNCKQRRRECTEEKPSCAYCLRLDDDCEYANYS